MLCCWDETCICERFSDFLGLWFWMILIDGNVFWWWFGWLDLFLNSGYVDWFVDWWMFFCVLGILWDFVRYYFILIAFVLSCNLMCLCLFERFCDFNDVDLGDWISFSIDCMLIDLLIDECFLFWGFLRFCDIILFWLCLCDVCCNLMRNDVVIWWDVNHVDVVRFYDFFWIWDFEWFWLMEMCFDDDLGWLDLFLNRRYVDWFVDWWMFFCFGDFLGFCELLFFVMLYFDEKWCCVDEMWIVCLCVCERFCDLLEFGISNDFDWWKCVLVMTWVIGSLSQ